MPDFTVRSDAVNVEQIMEQIRARIREKRGVDYTEQQIRELAAVRLEKFLDPNVVRSDLLQQFRRMNKERAEGSSNPKFGPNAIFEAQRPIVAKIRRRLHAILRLFLNPDPISQGLLRLNDIDPRADMYYELFHNLVIELTRAGIEVRNLKMQVESLAGRLEFNERRARALESVVVYKPSGDDPVASPPAVTSAAPQMRPAPSHGSRSVTNLSAPTASTTSDPIEASGLASTAAPAEGPGQRSRRRRRRRGRRGNASAVALMGGGATQALSPSPHNLDAPDGDSGSESDEPADGLQHPDEPDEPESDPEQ